MSSLDNLRTRLTYQGGIAQEDRMDQDKLRSLKKLYFIVIKRKQQF